MQQVKIYIETDSSSPKATEKHYGYSMQYMARSLMSRQSTDSLK